MVILALFSAEVNSSMFTVILFILILSLLVVVHEFGHFVTARKLGMRVYEFGMGFPPRAFGLYRDPVTKKFVFVWGRGKSNLTETVAGLPSSAKASEGDDSVVEFPATLYSLNWLPLGGFCKIKGESGDAASEPDSFAAQKAWKRITVLVAGVAMNILLAGVLLSVGFMVGLPSDASLASEPGAIVTVPPHVVVQQVDKGSVADKAGVRFGDTILSLDSTPVASAKEVVAYVREHSDRGIAIRLKRGSEEMTVLATPKPQLGLVLADATIIRYPWHLALVKGFTGALYGLINIFVSFFLLIKFLLLGKGLVFDVAGPVGIASIVGTSAQLGIQYLIHVTAMISLSLAAINILPIPALDGGRVLFVIIEKIIRRPVPMRYEQMAHTIGFILLMILIVIVTGRDILGLIR